MAFSLPPQKLSTSELLQALASERKMTSLMEKEILPAAGVFIYDNSNWVKLWYDPGNEVGSVCGTMTAYRAITKHGQRLWFVFTPAKTMGFHALTDDPTDAMQMAKAAWEARRAVRARWSEIETLAKDLRAGRERLEVRLEDAHKSPLCTLGIEGFLKSVGLSRVNRISGRTAAFLMKVEPQLGFVIYEAWVREQADRDVALPEIEPAPFPK